MAAHNALTASRAEEHRVAAELAQTVKALNDERSQIEAYGVAARDRAVEMEELRRQLAECRKLNAQIDVYASAEQDRTQEVEALRVELAGLRGEMKGLLAANAVADSTCADLRRQLAEQDRTREVEALRAELANLRGEVKGLHVANGMAESACAAMRGRVDEAIRQIAAAEAATIRAQTAGDDRARALEGELAAARAALADAWAETRSVAAHARSLELSTSWRLTAPLRTMSRIFLRRP